MAMIVNIILQAIGLGKQLVELVSAVMRLGLKLPESSERKVNAKKLTQDLGEWAVEAFPKKKKRWLHPVLRAEPFIKHLKDHDGYCEPEGECIATFGWAKLLYALNIRPGAGVISWESSRNFDPVPTGVITLEIEGPVLWHIINLYRLYDVSDPRDKERGGTYVLSFGTLSLSVEEQKYNVAFEPGELANKKEPFRYSPHVARQYFNENSGYLRFDRGQVMAIYLDNALPDGISDSTLNLPDPQTEHGENNPNDERVRKLVRALEALRVRRNPPTDNPYLLTSKWLEQASRIYRRTTSDGSTEPKLPELLVSIFAKYANQETINYLDKRYGGPTQEPYNWRTQAKELLQARCMLPNQSLHLVWRARNEYESNSQVKDEISRLIREEFDKMAHAFGQYTADPPIDILSKVQEEAKYLLANSRGFEIQNKPVIVLEFTPADETWNSKVLVQC